MSRRPIELTVACAVTAAACWLLRPGDPSTLAQAADAAKRPRAWRACNRRSNISSSSCRIRPMRCRT